MHIDKFIKELEENFDDLEAGSLKAETAFHDLKEWGSMHALIVIALAETEYEVTVTGDDLIACNTIEQLYHLINSRR